MTLYTEPCFHGIILPSPSLPGKHQYNLEGHLGSTLLGASLLPFSGKSLSPCSWREQSGEVLAGTSASQGRRHTAIHGTNSHQ